MAEQRRYLCQSRAEEHDVPYYRLSVVDQALAYAPCNFFIWIEKLGGVGASGSADALNEPAEVDVGPEFHRIPAHGVGCQVCCYCAGKH